MATSQMAPAAQPLQLPPALPPVATSSRTVFVGNVSQLSTSGDVLQVG